MAMMSVQGDVRQHQQQHPQLALPRTSRASFGSDRDESFVVKSEPSSLGLGTFKSPDSREGLFSKRCFMELQSFLNYENEISGKFGTKVVLFVISI